MTEPRLGLKLMLMGEGGTGKTYSIRTFIEAGIKPFVIFLEQGDEVIADLGAKVITKYLKPTAEGFSSLRQGALLVNTMSYESLTKMSPLHKEQNQQWIRLYDTLSDFKGPDGVSYGAVDHWDTDRVIIFDGLTGLSRIAMSNVVGAKPTRNQPEYGVAMDQIEKFLVTIANIKCHVLILAHPEKEANEITGGVDIMMSTLGRKLAPKIAPLFGEVLYARREAGNWFWSNDWQGAVTKFRIMKPGQRHPASWVPVIEAWKAVGGVITPTPAVKTA